MLCSQGPELLLCHYYAEFRCPRFLPLYFTPLFTPLSVIAGLLTVASSTGHMALMLRMAWCHPGQKLGFPRISSPRPGCAWVSFIPRCSVRLQEALSGVPTASSPGLCFKLLSKQKHEVQISIPATCQLMSDIIEHCFERRDLKLFWKRMEKYKCWSVKHFAQILKC